MKKKLIALALVSVLLLAQTASAATMYALDGRTLWVPDNEIEAYRQVNWYYGRPVTMYALDGRTLTIGENDIAMYEAVGWYRSLPTQTLYTADGRKANFRHNEVNVQLSVGWYTEPVTTMFSTNGKRCIVKDSEIAAHKRVNWYEAHELALGKTYNQVNRIFKGLTFWDVWRGGNNYYNSEYTFAIPAGGVCVEFSEPLYKFCPGILRHTNQSGMISKKDFETCIGYGGYAYVNDEFHDYEYCIHYYLKGYSVYIPCDRYGNIDISDFVLISK